MKNARESRACVDLAEEVGFEPTEPCGSTVFKTAAFNHSAIPPVRPDYIRCLIDAAPSVGILQVSFGRLRPGGASSCVPRPRVQRPRRCLVLRPAAPRPASATASPPLRSRPQRLALARARARDALRHALFIIAIHSGSICPFGKFCFTRLKFVVSCKMRI